MNKTNTPLSQIHLTMQKANSAVILPHRKPDGDTLGSCIALCRYLRSLGKAAFIYTTDTVPENLSFLDQSAFVAQASMDIDLVLAIDSSDEGRLDGRLSHFDAKVVNIDHHQTNTYFGDENYVLPDMSSTGEIVYSILKAWQADFDEPMMAALYTAIATDTNRFYYSSTTPNTLSAVADLMEQGLEITPLNTLIYGQTPFEKKQLQGYSINTAVRSHNGRVIYTEVSDEVQQKFNCHDTDEIVEALRDIAGVEVSVLAYEYGGDWQFSLRSKTSLDVGAIAYALGGGGHVGAAGINVKPENFPATKEKLFQLIEAKLEVG